MSDEQGAALVAEDEWNELGKIAALYVGTLLGSIAIAPYTRCLIRHSGCSMWPSGFLISSLAQNTALFRVVIAAELTVASAMRPGACYIETGLGGLASVHAAGQMLLWSLGLGGLGGGLLLSIGSVLIPTRRCC